MAFVVEQIPDDHFLFRRIHHSQMHGGVISSAAYDKERLSVNWERYSSAEKTADQNSGAVTAIAAGPCRTLNLTVEHTPVEPDQPFGPNQSHSEICGKKSNSLKQKLRDMAKEVWRKK